jgi:hypothetical protein
MQVPLDHHYLPVFYLKRWAGEDGRLCRFSRPYDEIKPKRVPPKKTGFVERLYETRALPREQAQQVEQHFMRHVDTFAAQALAMLENDDERIHQDSEPRSAWSCFIMSLLMRTPEDISALKSGLEKEMERRLISKYGITKRPGDPYIFSAYLMKDPHYFDRWAMSLLPQLIDHRDFGQSLNNMRWLVRRIPSGAGEFLTSDRPVVRSWTLSEPNAYLFLPIGPKAVFVAVNDIETQRMVEARDVIEQVEAMNQLVAGHAVNFVCARDDSYLDFVRRHMGTRHRETLIEQLVAHRRNSSALE